jgi:hypothetical protein
MSKTDLGVVLFFTIPFVWILSAFLARYILMRRGYERSDSWLPGCLLGPAGVIIALLMPYATPQISYWLHFFGLFFAGSVMLGIPCNLARGVVYSNLLWIVSFVIFEILIYFGVRRIYPKTYMSNAIRNLPPAQAKADLENQIWIQSTDYSVKTFPYINAAETLRIYRSHDWASEFARLEEMRENQEDFCPPGIGLNRVDGAYLQILPDGAGCIMVDYRREDLPTRKPSPFTELPESSIDAAFEAFHREDDAWFRANLR